MSKSKDLTMDSLRGLLKTASENILSNADLMDIIRDLTYIAKDNGYDDSMLEEILDLLYDIAKGKIKMTEREYREAREMHIVRRVDDLGRIVIPKEVRRQFDIREGTIMEYFITDNEIILQKYKNK